MCNNKRFCRLKSVGREIIRQKQAEIIQKKEHQRQLYCTLCQVFNNVWWLLMMMIIIMIIIIVIIIIMMIMIKKKGPLTLWDNQSAKNTGLGCTSWKFLFIYLLVTLAHPNRQRLDRIHVSVCIQLTTHSRGISKGFSTWILNYEFAFWIVDMLVIFTSLTKFNNFGLFIGLKDVVLCKV